MRTEVLASCCLLALAFAGDVAAAKLDRAQLQAQGVIIGEIRIHADDVFDLERPEENRFVYRLANRLHAETREGTVARLLLFKVGEPYDDQKVRESERLLRQRHAFYDARIRPRRLVDGKVVVEVRTRDIWSLRPTAEFGRSGGENRSEFGVEELNFLGLGTELTLGYANDVERESSFLALRQPQLGASRWQADLLAADNSDGHAWRLGLTRPFFALDTRWSAGIDGLDQIQREQRYRGGEIVDRYEHSQRGLNLLYGWSSGLVNGWTQRFSVGTSFDEHRFASVAPIDGIGTTVLPDDRTLVYPWIGYELVQDRFIVEHNRDQIGRAEDVLLGWHAYARLGLATEAFGSDRRAWVYSGALSYGGRPDEANAWLVSAEASGRRERGEFAAMLAHVEARYDFRWNEHTTTHARLDAQIGQSLDLDQLVSLGGDNGLRGYPYRYANGERTAVLTLEQRVYTDWYPGRLFRVGAAAFVDIGRSWGDLPEGPEALGTLRDVGIGLRLANTRSGRAHVIHIDLAHPLDGSGDIDQLQFLISTRKSF